MGKLTGLDYLTGGASVINTGMSMIDNAAQRKWASKENQYNRDFQLQMYERQLEDSIDWRTHQEQYNSPEAQMQRYRDAGINPMYAVTGSMQNTVTTPISASGSGGSQISSSTKGIQPLDAVSIAQARMLNSQAKSYQADAYSKMVEANHKAFEYGVDAELASLDFGGGKNIHQFKAEVRAQALKYEKEVQDMDFEEKKKWLLQQDVLRANTNAQAQEQLNLLREQLSKAKNEKEVSEVAKNWAAANQWIDAASEILGLAIGAFGAARGTPIMPYVSRPATAEEY